MAKIVIIEDNEDVRLGWKYLINSIEKHQVVADYEDCESFLNNLNHDQPTMALMDINLPGIDGIEGTKKAKKILPNLNVMIISIFEDPKMIFNALCAGATGYLVKNSSPEELFKAIDQLEAGGSPMSTNVARMVIESFHKAPTSPLSSRETEVLSGLVKGRSYNDIAKSLFVSKDTVKTHIKNIYRKLEVSNKSEAIEKATQEKLLDWNDR